MRWLKSNNNNNSSSGTSTSDFPAMTTTNTNNISGSAFHMMRPPMEIVGGAVAPPRKFTILKRPTQGQSSPLVNPAPSPFDDDPATASANLGSPTEVALQQSREAAVKRTPVVKSLEQRKQEYAEARLRILGDAKFSDDDDEEEVKTPPPNVTTLNTGNNSGGQGNRRNNNYRGGGGGGGTSQSQRPPMFNASIPPPPFDPVIRVPRGPDGTVGFQGRR